LALTVVMGRHQPMVRVASTPSARQDSRHRRLGNPGASWEICVLHHRFVTGARRGSRFQVAAVLTALAMAIGAAPAAAFDPGANLVLTKVADASSPVLVTHAGDGSGRMFIVEKTGRIRVITAGGTLLSAPFLNLSASILTSGEQGLLGLAFHPQFETNGKFYVYLTLKNGSNAVNEYRVETPGANTVRWQTGRRIMTIAHPGQTNHNGGNLAFGPDGYLYIGTGDGGGGGDPLNRSQNLNSFLGKMLRINPNLPSASGARNYRIPQTNPYVGKAGLDEIWARGLRNPWRFSFDRANGDLWIGDVGQNRFDEVDVSRAVSGRNAGRGANYGWRVMEGAQCFNPASGCNKSGKVLPVAVSSLSGGNCALTGGYVYRGPDVKLAGGYLYGDFCTGRIWGLDAAAPSTPVLLADTNLSISSFGEDEAGNVYVVDLNGSIYRLSST
jgi:glucose/arabinose dehydrogenase